MLFLQNGYNNTSIQNIIDAMNIAKGTFYHYFKSKDELLDAIVDQMTTELSEHLRPILDTDKNGIEKLNEIFKAGSNFKAEKIDTFLVLIKTLYRDENFIIRNRMFQSSIMKNGPIISQIIKQGIKEKLFNTPYPDEIAGIMINLGKELNENIVRLILEKNSDPKTMVELLLNKTRIYQDMMERILGADPGSLSIYIPGDFEALVKKFTDRLREENNIESADDRYKMW